MLLNWWWITSSRLLVSIWILNMWMEWLQNETLLCTVIRYSRVDIIMRRQVNKNQKLNDDIELYLSHYKVLDVVQLLTKTNWAEAKNSKVLLLRGEVLRAHIFQFWSERGGTKWHAVLLIIIIKPIGNSTSNFRVENFAK